VGKFESVHKTDHRHGVTLKGLTGIQYFWDRNFEHI